MILTGKDILKNKRDIIITPFNIKQLNPNSYDLTLNPNMFVYVDKELDVKASNEIKAIKIPEEGYTLQPGELYIARSNEYTETNNFVPLLADKSSLARLGLSTHFNAGFGDNGFKGTWTIELSVVKPLKIYPNMKICQIYYNRIPKQKDAPKYQGKYQGQSEATASRSHKDYEIKG